MTDGQPKPEKIRCDACPVMCYIADGRSGACDRYANDGGQLVRLDPLTILERRVEDGGDVVPFLGEGADWDGGVVTGRDRFVTAIGAGTVPREALNTSRIRRLLAMNDAELSRLVSKHWGRVKESSRPEGSKRQARESPQQARWATPSTIRAEFRPMSFSFLASAPVFGSSTEA